MPKAGGKGNSDDACEHEHTQCPLPPPLPDRTGGWIECTERPDRNDVRENSRWNCGQVI